MVGMHSKCLSSLFRIRCRQKRAIRNVFCSKLKSICRRKTSAKAIPLFCLFCLNRPLSLSLPDGLFGATLASTFTFLSFFFLAWLFLFRRMNLKEVNKHSANVSLSQFKKIMSRNFVLYILSMRMIAPPPRHFQSPFHSFHSPVRLFAKCCLSPPLRGGPVTYVGNVMQSRVVWIN